MAPDPTPFLYLIKNKIEKIPAILKNNIRTSFHHFEAELCTGNERSFLITMEWTVWSSPSD
jgi:hypothetical protein